jgi:hypothetical protein
VGGAVHEDLAVTVEVPIHGWEGLYAARDDGAILSLPRTVQQRNGVRYTAQGRVLLPVRRKDGYRAVMLWRDGRCTSYLVHRLIAAAFIPNPAQKPEVNHRNHEKADNRPENLEWVTAQENTNHKVSAGRQGRAYGPREAFKRTGKTAEELAAIAAEAAAPGTSIASVARKYGMGQDTVKRLRGTVCGAS